MTERIQHWFLHVDLDAFFASVEQLDHPEYRGKPVIVGGKPEDRRSVVSTASYEARKYGVHSAMPTAQAYKLCPQGIYVYGRMDRYSELSYSIMEILKSYSPDVDQMSIDEAFVDITGTEKLFGSPQETAYKIKNEIKQKTGLTVSVGLSQTKYFAKIASDINKPDGFYFVEPGKEEEFILGLPLKKIFGIGAKSQENLQKIGLCTPRDIHERTLESLQFLCGQNQGTFLYNVVRGKVEDSFNKKNKTHSLSSETTFPYDVNDSYTLETTILNLAYGIRFRLLKENGFSRTVVIKIRYEDFSTVSIRQTYDSNILTIDDLFLKAKELFHKKWEKGRGIRLLGLGLDNVENEDKPFQQNLFEDSSEKKQKLEKAILNLSKKHPEIKVHKARMLEKNGRNCAEKIKTLIFFTLFCLFSLNSRALFAQEKEKNSRQLFEYDIKGFWEAGFSYNALSTFGNNTDFAVSSGTPVFKQQIDLSASFKFGQGWSFFVDFAENFNRNTFTINYDGKKYLRNFKASNRNILFPDYYSSKITGYNPGGGQNEAPGISLHFEDFENQKFKGDFILRYDLTSQKSLTFYGKNRVTDSLLKIENFVYGKQFVIPEEYISQIDSIYVENKNGDFFDSNGKKYKKLSSSEYLVINSLNLLVLSDSAGSAKKDGFIPRILITFNKNFDAQDFGNYSDSSSFLGKIQDYFSQYKSDLNLSDYTPGIEDIIEEKKALILQQASVFSPFLVSNIYDTGFLKQSDTYVINKSSEQKNQFYNCQNSDDDFSSLQQDFFKEKHLYTKVTPASSQSKDLLLPENRFPFADSDPMIYLTGNSDSNLAVLQRSYSPVTNFDIGKNAENSSIRVLINGMDCSQFSYSATSGFVSINQNINDTDKIIITWNEQTSDSQNGVITSAAGFLYNINPNLVTDFSLTAKVPFSPDKTYSLIDEVSSTYVAINGGINYKKDNILITDALSFSLEKENTLDTLLVNQTTEKKNTTFYLNQSQAIQSSVIPKLNITGAPVLDADKKSSLSSVASQTDAAISGYKIPLDWKMQNDENWTCIDIKLNKSSLLSNANQLQISLKKESEENLEGYRLFLQLGIDADNTYAELTDQIPTWELTDILPSDFLSSSNKWTVVTLDITPQIQARLNGKNDVRLIVFKNTSGITSGSIFFGPYEPVYKGVNLESGESLNATSTFIKDTDSPFFKKNINASEYCDYVFWNESNASTDTIITLWKYLKQNSFQNYKFINYDFKFNYVNQISKTSDSNPVICLRLEDDAGLCALQIEINQNAASLIASKNNLWQTLCINKETSEVSLNNIVLPADSYTLFINESVIPVKQIIKINTNSNNQLAVNGEFYCGSLYYTENNLYFMAKNHLVFEYTKKNSILKIKDKTILKDGFVKANSTAQLKTSSLNVNGTSLSTIQGGITLFDFVIKNDYGFILQNEDSRFTNISYSVSNQVPLFNFLSLSQDFVFNPQYSYNKKSDKIVFDFNKLNIPLSMYFDTFAVIQNIQKEQQYSSALEFAIPFPAVKWNGKINLSASQKIKSANYTESSFTQTFEDITLFEFSSGNNNFESKNIAFIFDNALTTKWNGLAPQLKWDISSYKDINSTYNTKDKSNIIFTLPFAINKQQLSFSYSKYITHSHNNSSNNTYADDFVNLWMSQKELNNFYKTIPFAELFDSSISDNFIIKNDLVSYSSKYSLNWKRPLFNSIKDLFIPVAADLSVTRDIICSDNINDIYQIKATVNNSFINLLGKNSKINLFPSINQDEYSGFHSVIVKFSSGGTDFSFLISGYESLLLFIDVQNTWRTAFDYKFSDSDNWQLRLSGVWSHSAKDTVLLMLPALFYKEIDSKEKKISRKESLGFSFGETSGSFTQKYEYQHYCEAALQKNLSINSTIGTTLSHTQEKAVNLNITASLGVKLSF